jgi:hypothetical protein
MEPQASTLAGGELRYGRARRRAEREQEKALACEGLLADAGCWSVHVVRRSLLEGLNNDASRIGYGVG